MYRNEKRGESKIKNKGQVTIFIIIAILIVGLAILFYFVIPRAEITTVFDEKNPNAFIQACLEDKIKDTVEIVSLQGGSIAPEHYFTYNNTNIEYLCYTSEYYITCSIQRPFLIEHIESEIEDEIKEDVRSCFNALKESYEKKNYNVELRDGITNVELLPKRVVTSFNYVLTVSKDQTDRYDSFSVVLNNNLYELVSISNDMIDWEATHGDFDTLYYMALFSNIKIEKYKQLDGTIIYIVINRDTGNKFQFASRSVAWPPGYGEVPVFYE
jgi:hypothetical protein